MGGVAAHMGWECVCVCVCFGGEGVIGVTSRSVYSSKLSIAGRHFFTHGAWYLKHPSPLFVHSIYGTTSRLNPLSK